MANTLAFYDTAKVTASWLEIGKHSSLFVQDFKAFKVRHEHFCANNQPKFDQLNFFPDRPIYIWFKIMPTGPTAWEPTLTVKWALFNYDLIIHISIILALNDLTETNIG
jgi:hypothetical protein